MILLFIFYSWHLHWNTYVILGREWSLEGIWRDCDCWGQQANWCRWRARWFITRYCQLFRWGSICDLALLDRPRQQFQWYIFAVICFRELSVLQEWLSIYDFHSEKHFSTNQSGKSRNWELFCFLINCVLLIGEHIQTTVKLLV